MVLPICRLDNLRRLMRSPSRSNGLEILCNAQCTPTVSFLTLQGFQMQLLPKEGIVCGISMEHKIEASMQARITNIWR